MSRLCAGWRCRLLVALGLVALGALELVGLNATAIREVTWGIPTAFDQAYYGLQSFGLHDGILKRGLPSALAGYLLQPGPAGVLLPLQGALFCLAFGPGWLRLLNVNFVYFLLLQSATAYAAWYVGGKRARWAILGLGLVLALGTPYFWAGGVMDFRLDFAAFCLYGIFIAAVIRSNAFLSRSWSAMAAAIATVTVWLRALTLSYFVGVSALLMISFLVRREANSRVRLRNVALVLWAVCVLDAPLLLLQASAIRDYYWKGHVIGDEPQILARVFGLTSAWKHVIFYPSSLVRTHLGVAFLSTAGVLLLFAVTRRVNRTRPRAPDGDEPSGDALAFCALCLVVPFGVLTLDVSKSPVVAGITAPAALWLVILTAMRSGGIRMVDGKSGTVLAALILLLGLGHTSWELSRRIDRAYPPADVRGLVAVYDRIWWEAARMNSSQPMGLSVFGVNEYLRAEVADFLAYDRHGTLLGLRGEMGQTIFATDLAASIAGIDRSAFVITAPPRPVQALDLPYNATLQPLIPALTEYVRERFTYIAQFRLGGTQFELYRRPHMRISGVRAGQMMGEGILVEIGEDDRSRAVEGFLRGAPDVTSVSGLGVSARLAGRHEEPEQAVPVNIADTASGDPPSILPAASTRGRVPLRVGLCFPGAVDQGSVDGRSHEPTIWPPRGRVLRLAPIGADRRCPGVKGGQGTTRIHR